ncbi:MAG TPA: hypothetical protein VGS62_08790, partial [Streptosporangiaceae bacterium]|nr:hypothetical protein [Streptosporangiaceae bacterium]
DAVALSKEHAGRAGGMTPPPGKFAVTVRIERPDGQFVTSSRLIPDDLITSGGDKSAMQDWTLREVGSAFVSAYHRAAELAE